ncbi:MAG: hypothetical protein GY866_35345 [Proteobacteria bacterium]|nr:hypothetical protein [Pseudomonadota bacterium]
MRFSAENVQARSPSLGVGRLRFAHPTAVFDIFVPFVFFVFFVVISFWFRLVRVGEYLGV